VLQGANDAEQPSLSHTAATPLGPVDTPSMMGLHQVNAQDLADSARLCNPHVSDVIFLRSLMYTDALTCLQSYQGSIVQNVNAQAALLYSALASSS